MSTGIKTTFKKMSAEVAVGLGASRASTIATILESVEKGYTRNAQAAIEALEHQMDTPQLPAQIVLPSGLPESWDAIGVEGGPETILEVHREVREQKLDAFKRFENMGAYQPDF
jgi:hypothetical protein